MPVSADFLAFVADQLAGFGPIAIRRMFSGAGLFRGGRMFGLVADDVLYFKVGDANRAPYLAAGAKAFTYSRRGSPAKLTSYFEVPAGVLDDPDALAEWARVSFAVAHAAAAKPARPKRKKEKK